MTLQTNFIVSCNKSNNNNKNFIRFSCRVSNLADIFEADESEQTFGSNPSLKYIPSKAIQFQKTTNTNTEKSKWDVAIAKLVSAYKLYVYIKQIELNV